MKDSDNRLIVDPNLVDEYKTKINEVEELEEKKDLEDSSLDLETSRDSQLKDITDTKS